MNASKRGSAMVAKGAVAASSTMLATIASNERLRSTIVGFAVARKGFVVDGVASAKAGPEQDRTEALGSGSTRTDASDSFVRRSSVARSTRLAPFLSFPPTMSIEQQIHAALASVIDPNTGRDLAAT